MTKTTTKVSVELKTFLITHSHPNLTIINPISERQNPKEQAAKVSAIFIPMQ
jgi:hypothetical protein